MKFDMHVRKFFQIILGFLCMEVYMTLYSLFPLISGLIAIFSTCYCDCYCILQLATYDCLEFLILLFHVLM